MSVWRREAAFVVGHRGGRGAGWPSENTLAAFERAWREGAPAIELDVRACATGEVVVFHDVDLRRLTQGRERMAVAACTGAELARVRLDGEPIPRLDDVLAWARERGLGVNVELKHDDQDLRTLLFGVRRAVRRHGADVLLSSFHPGVVAALGVILPERPRALLTAHDHRRFGTWAPEWAAFRPFLSALHLEEAQATPARIARAVRRGLRVGVWTVNDPTAARKLAAAGASWIITDAPGRLREALEAREPPSGGR